MSRFTEGGPKAPIPIEIYRLPAQESPNPSFLERLPTFSIAGDPEDAIKEIRLEAELTDLEAQLRRKRAELDAVRETRRVRKEEELKQIVNNKQLLSKLLTPNPKIELDPHRFNKIIPKRPY